MTMGTWTLAVQLNGADDGLGRDVHDKKLAVTFGNLSTTRSPKP